MASARKTATPPPPPGLNRVSFAKIREPLEVPDLLALQTASAEVLRTISSSVADTQPVFEAIVQAGLRLYPNAAVAVVLPVISSRSIITRSRSDAGMR